MKIPRNSVIDTASVAPIALPESRSSSGIWRLADHVSARMPSAIDSARFTTPRTSGTLAQRSPQPGTSWVVDGDVAVGRAHGDRPLVLAAHHHALDDGLAAHGAGGAGASAMTT